jgi:16S rRNA (uracil1498-N3)-methyltransferase
MRRFFIEAENISGSTAVLTGTEARHISTVLRLSPDTTITLFDGSGSLYEARITKISPARVETKITTLTPYIDTADDIRPALHLAVGLLKGKKMDFIIQKSTELGIESLRPFRSRYCAAHDAGAGKPVRWQRIALEACKQCNRPKPPDLYGVTDYNNLISLSGRENHDLKIIFWEEEAQNTLQETFDALSKAKSVLVLIGPEGGFSSGEAAAAIAAGFQPTTLGSRILRAETAVIAAAAILQHELGNLA